MRINVKTLLAVVALTCAAPSDDASCAEAGVRAAGLAFVHRTEK